jgi:iron(III) transport system substrate-binding protein
MKNRTLAAVLILVSALAWSSVSFRSRDALVVYCAHDLVFAQSVLDEFTRRTGIPIVVVGDTEATKSLGLVQRLLIEKDRPRCDVFWNNQLLGTMQLAEEGVLQPYRGSGYARMPERFKDPAGRWVGFAGRLRVWIVNSTKMPATVDAVEALLQSQDLSRMAIAQPLFGTTLSHFTILWGESGPGALQCWYRNLQKRGCQIVPGNGPVKNLVAEGVCDAGWTDTDDFFVGRDDGFPVAQLPIRIAGETICLPNSVAIIRGTQKLASAQKLVDYLLSQEVELALARSASRQVPLGPVDRSQLPEEVRPLLDWAHESIDVREFYPARKPCLDWLKREYAQ